MTFDDIWDALKGIGRKAWSAVGASSAFITLLAALFYKDVLKDADIPPLVKDLTPLITLAVCFTVFTAVMLASRLLSAWAEKKGHVHVDARETVTYHAYPYKPGSDLLRLSEYAHRVFKGDTMKAEIVQAAVRNKAATGLRLTDPQGKNVGFLDVFHFTDTALEKWKNGDLPEDTLGEDDFVKIPAEGEDLNLAMGAIYVKPDADRGVAHQFANIGELFLRKTFPRFHRINLYATIFAPDGERIAQLYKFEISKKAKDRTGPFAHNHDLRLRVIELQSLPHSIGGVGGSRHVVIEVLN